MYFIFQNTKILVIKIKYIFRGSETFYIVNKIILTDDR